MLQNLPKRSTDASTEVTFTEKLSVFGFGVLYLLWNLRMIRGGGVQQGLEGSWITALNWSSYLNLHWSANSLVFPYGPLYYLEAFLFLPEFHSREAVIFVNVASNLLYLFFFTYIYSLFAKLLLHTQRRWLLIPIVLLLVTQTPSLLLTPLFVAYFLLPIILNLDTKPLSKYEQRIRYAKYTLAIFLLAVTSFVKANYLYESILFIILLLLALIYYRLFLDAIWCLVAFSSFMALIWTFVAKQSIAELFSYLRVWANVSGGYTEAMMLDFTELKFFQIFILAGIYLLALLVGLISQIQTKQLKIAIAWMFPLIVLGFALKSAFVRADHVHQFLVYTTLSALYYFYLVEFTKLSETEGIDIKRSNLLGIFVTPVLFLVVISTQSVSGFRFLPNNNFMKIDSLLPNNEETLLQDRQFLKQAYNLEPTFLAQIDPDASIDIIPWDISLLYGYDLKWTPRPVLQSYASYTPALDDLDANFLLNPHAPEQIIYSLSTIDNRYAPFDTPHTFRVLLSNYAYTVDTTDNRFALLRKLPHPLQQDLIPLQEGEYRLNEEILIPKVQDGLVFLFVDIRETFLGKVLNLGYKATPLYVEIKQRQNIHKFRYIRTSGLNGLFVSKYIENLEDVKSVFDGGYKQDIKSIRFLGNSWLYQQDIKVYFYKGILK